jgi:1-acyl-sn-glycerol-3-phosphate acyltransferase
VVLWRSLAFNVLFAIFTVTTATAGLPVVLLFPRRHVLALAKWWTGMSLGLLRLVVGIEVEARGLHRVPPGAALVVSKHQSALETLALVPYLPDCVFVLKRELIWIPLFGWFLARLRMIAINRARRSEALAEMLNQSQAAAQAGRQIVIFPEGTRRPVGAPPRYKQGVLHLYEQLGLPCVPVALDTGVFWPRRTLWRRRGRAVIEFLEPIPPGLDRATFQATLQERVEAASARLAAEALGLPPVKPFFSIAS